MKTITPIKRVLIANRGEIALRITHTLRELGIESVAVYSPFDAESLHVAAADHAYPLSGKTNDETYLSIPQLIEAVRATGADAVHPGYGFLSENTQFCERIESETGARFIGPTAKAIALMGDKVAARNLMQNSEVPMVPGTPSAGSAREIHEFAADVGFPLILKAAGGGGGRGMRIVRDKSEIDTSFEACQREAKAYFGNSAVFCERYIDHPRHIEIQVLCDQHGNGVHLFERDCTVQRRHQKLFEEAPSTYLNPQQRERLGAWALAVAKAVGYVGVGTVEFICESPDRAYFMEMNTRIQVEHPVTEWITGIDLIAEQVRVAEGHALTMKQADIRMNGWALEARINAEDPARDFLPNVGRVATVRWPTGPFVRIDSHLYPGYLMPGQYDSLVAKLSVWGPTRELAMARMRRALADLEISGLKTTVPFHEALLEQPDFVASTHSTALLAEQEAYFNAALTGQEPHDDDALVAALCCVLAEVNAQQTLAVDQSHLSTLWRRQGRIDSLTQEVY